MKMESVISTFETCNTFFHLKSSDSAIGNQIRKRRRIVMNIENAIQMAIEMASSGGNDILMVSVRKSLREKLDVHTNAIERNNKKASCILLV